MAEHQKTARNADAEPRSLRWQAIALPWVIPLAFGLCAAEVQRHWHQGSLPIHVANLLLLAAFWVGVLRESRWAVHFGAGAINGAVLIQLAGGLLLQEFGDEMAGAEVLNELLFWAPAVCAWWASCYWDRTGRAVALAAVLYGGLFLGDRIGLNHHFHEFLLQGAAMIGIVTLFARAMSRPELCEGPRAFDSVMHDTLTNVASRSYFEAEMAHTAAVSERYRQPFSLIVAEIGDFERYSAEFGREAGDRLLREFSWLIAERIRRSDSVCRWEGAKFAVLLPNTDAVAAANVAASLREAMAAASPGGHGAVNADFGLAEHRPGEDAMFTFDLAEAALTKARNEGPRATPAPAGEATV